jgi:hypothetical protein
MGKKCIICEEPAQFKIKDTTDFYCPDCAQENFADLSMLLTLEEEAQMLKKIIEEKLAEKEVGEESIVVKQITE